ncbi:holo-[acyl-carrier-protein] synthase [Maudiozyma exigua]|uniref:Holo-[acyl-carrier-protein] synthase n=1 Tax=Maudiozyma exigua TaxID=34358 RepID=A0A9P6WFU8_MAUEX|nr:holo-[acyl-carrier-protein] synthase [Kazachstania exigua]
MNNVLGIGTDIVYIPRIVGLLKRHHVTGDYRRLVRVTNKFMTSTEQERFFKLLQKTDSVDSNEQLINYTAGVWATKESLLKALSGYIAPWELPPCTNHIF